MTKTPQTHNQRLELWIAIAKYINKYPGVLKNVGRPTDTSHMHCIAASPNDHDVFDTGFEHQLF